MRVVSREGREVEERHGPQEPPGLPVLLDAPARAERRGPALHRAPVHADLTNPVQVERNAGIACRPVQVGGLPDGRGPGLRSGSGSGHRFRGRHHGQYVRSPDVEQWRGGLGERRYARRGGPCESAAQDHHQARRLGGRDLLRSRACRPQAPGRSRARDGEPSQLVDRPPGDLPYGGQAHATARQGAAVRAGAGRHGAPRPRRAARVQAPGRSAPHAPEHADLRRGRRGPPGGRRRTDLPRGAQPFRAVHVAPAHGRRPDRADGRGAQRMDARPEDPAGRTHVHPQARVPGQGPRRLRRAVRRRVAQGGIRA